MRKIVLILILIGVHGSQLRSAIVEPNKNWDFVYDLTKEIRTEKSHTEMSIQLILTCAKYGTLVYYEQREAICGSIHPTVTETTFNKRFDITRKEGDVFISKLEQAGFLKLPESTKIPAKESDLFWYEDLTFRTGEKEINRSYNYSPRGRVRNDVNEAVFSFIDEMGLDEPDDPLSIEVFVKGQTNSILSLELSEPLWNPVYYHGKIIESMEVYQEQGARKTIIKIVDNNNQLISTWNATIPDPNEEYAWYEGLAAYEGISAYEGKTIDCILINTQITTTEGDYEPSRKVTLQEVLEEPDKFHGKRICTKGFYDFEYEGMDFYDRRGNNVWIGQWSSFAKRKWADLPIPNLVEGLLFGRQRGCATVEGIFLKGPSGHFGFWPGEIVRITRFDAHFKLDYIFWTILLVIMLGVVFLIRRIRKRRLGLQTIERN